MKTLSKLFAIVMIIQLMSCAEEAVKPQEQPITADIEFSLRGTLQGSYTLDDVTFDISGIQDDHTIQVEVAPGESFTILNESNANMEIGVDGNVIFSGRTGRSFTVEYEDLL